MLAKPGNLLALSALCGALSFAAGFAFGVLRRPVLIPAFGDRMGHLAEFPMVTLAACVIGIRIGGKSAAPALAPGVFGVFGVAALIAFESAMAPGFMRLSLAG